MSARDIVIAMVKEHKPDVYVEVGCWKGELTDQIQPLVKEAWAIDPHKQDLNEFDQYRCRMGAQQPVPQDELDAISDDLTRRFGDKFLRMTSLEASRRFADNSVDFVFIDAIHDYEHVKEDIVAWYPKVKKGGIIAGDDYKTRFPDLCEGVDEVLPDRQLTDIVWWHEVH